MSAQSPWTPETRWPLFVIRYAPDRCVRQVSIGNDDGRVTFEPLGRAHLFEEERLARAVRDVILECAPGVPRPLDVVPVTEDEARAAVDEADAQEAIDAAVSRRKFFRRGR